MSEAIKAVKKRGRPKKTTEAETILVIDSSVEPTSNIRGRVGKGKSTTSAAKPTSHAVESDATLKKKATRKVVAKTESVIGTSSKARTVRGSAKGKDSDTPIPPEPENLSNATTHTSITSKQDDLKQFERSSASTVERPVPEHQRLSATDLVDTIQLANKPVHTIPASFTQSIQPKIHRLDTEINELETSLRQLSLERINLSYNQFQSQSEIIREAQVAFRTNKLRQQITDLGTNLQQYSTHIQSISSSQRHQHLQSIDNKLSNLIGDIEHTNLAIAHHQAESNLNILDSSIQSTGSQIQSILSQQRHQRIKGLDSKLQDLSSEIQHTTTTLAHHHAESNLNILHTSLQRTATQLQYIKAASASPQAALLPSQFSTTAAMPSRQPTSRPNPIPTGAPKSIPHVYSPPPRSNPQSGPKRTDPRLLMRDPAYRAKGWQWIRRVMAIPVVIATSILLYQRYEQTTAGKSVHERMLGRERGSMPGDMDERVKLGASDWKGSRPGVKDEGGAGVVKGV